MRASGILMPVFSLPSPYGIGTLGRNAFEFVDFLVEAGQKYWQILPISPTNFGDSPYQSFSSFAGNPYFIDLDILCEKGLLLKNEIEAADFGDDSSAVDYEKLYKNRFDILKIAADRFFRVESPEFKSFCEENSDWLLDYALFMAIKDDNNGRSFTDWAKNIKFRDSKALQNEKKRLKSEIDFYCFLQFEFFSQWQKLKDYANQNGIKIIGDMPFYVAFDSAEVWAEPEQFDLDSRYNPISVAGVPPDAFCDEGQLWGSPIYNWDYMKRQSPPYEWWCRRIAHALRIYDILRIDHFRGFESYYAIPFGSENAKTGAWKKGPGLELFKAAETWYGKPLPIIAEDLGLLTPAVKRLLKKSGFPGMKVLQFAFSGDDSDYLPHNYDKNCIVYTGTHDNDTILGWGETADSCELERALAYMNIDKTHSLNWSMIKLALASVADTAIICMPDLLGLSSEARINTPATLGGNWKWRIADGCTNSWLAKIIKEICSLYGRA